MKRSLNIPVGFIAGFVASSLILVVAWVVLDSASSSPGVGLKDGDFKNNDDVYWVGHLNPDSDSICSAIGAAFLYGGTPTRTGEMNKESQFILRHFDVEAPRLITDYNGKKTGIVDFNQRSQLQKTIDMTRIVAIIDHHSLGDRALSVPRPIRIDMRPWGSAASIIANEAILSGKKIPRKIAGVLFSAILSDTLLLTSPITTERDRKLAAYLAPIANIEDVQGYGMEMLKAKSNLEDVGDKKIVNLDLKSFEISGQKIAFGVAETVSPDALMMRKEGLLEGMKATKAEDHLDYLFFAIVDILNKQSFLLILSDKEAQLAQRSYHVHPENGVAVLPHRVSRKNDFIPPIKAALASP